MANITKRVNRKLAAHLNEGEEVGVAILVEPKGTYGIGMIALAAMPRTTGKSMADRAAEAHARDGGMAADFPGTSSVIAVTGHRILVTPSNGLRFGDPALDVPLGSMFVKSISRKGMGKRLELAFSDGSMVTVDAQALQPMALFADTIGRIG